MKKLKEATVSELINALRERLAEAPSTIDDAEEKLEDLGRQLMRDGLALWIAELSSGEDDRPKPCPRCSRDVGVNEKRQRTLHGMHGSFQYVRNHYYCRHCKESFYPLDDQIAAPAHGSGTKALSARVADFGINGPYEEASERFSMHYGRTISTYFIRCVIDRLPLPEYGALPRPKPDERITVQVDGCQLPMTTGWKEAKLGVIVAESKHHHGSKDGVRGQISEATYVATMGARPAFEAHLERVIPKRRTRAERLRDAPVAEVVFVADGAPWIWQMQQRLYPEAIQILDWAHAVSHAVDCAKVLFDDTTDWTALWQARVETLLADGDIETLLTELDECLATLMPALHQQALKKLRRYYGNHRLRMDYLTHRQAGRVIGSGIVCSGCVSYVTLHKSILHPKEGPNCSMDYLLHSELSV